MFNLKLNQIIEAIRKNKARLVLVQLPDGLKPKAREIADAIEIKTQAKTLIWFSTCFGACDLPKVKNLPIDLTIQFGHSKLNHQSY